MLQIYHLKSQSAKKLLQQNQEINQKTCTGQGVIIQQHTLTKQTNSRIFQLREEKKKTFYLHKVIIHNWIRIFQISNITSTRWKN